MSEAEPGKETATERLLGSSNKSLAVLGSIVAGLVALNSGLTSCSNDTIARYAGFRAAVSAEESFWKDRFQDYLGALDESDDAKRRAKLSALSALADHSIPDFSEYRLGLIDNPGAKSLAVARLEGMQKILKAAIANPASSEPDVARAQQAVNAFDSEQKASEQKTSESAATPDAEAIAQTTVVAAAKPEASLETQVLTVGDPRGWDVDVFWCAGQRSTDVYGEAVVAAKALKKIANTGKPIPGTDIRLGRIRIRVLPELRQGANQGYPDSGYQIRFDAGSGEVEAAKAVQQLLLANTPATQFILQQTRTPTRFYLSLFACG